MSSVIDRVSTEWTASQLDTEIGRGVRDMLMNHYPWQTFSTLTTKTVASPERMKQIVWRTLHRRPLKGVEAFWVLEPFKERGGVHAHILTRNEPKEHSWNKTWDWYHNKQGIGRFESKPIFEGSSDMFKVAAYVSKYCTKALSNAQWGFHGIGGNIKSSDFRQGPNKKGTSTRGRGNDSLREEQVAWKAGKWNRPKIIRKKFGKIWMGETPWDARSADSPEMEQALKRYNDLPKRKKRNTVPASHGE